jgi:hypothetical protein
LLLLVDDQVIAVNRKMSLGFMPRLARRTPARDHRVNHGLTSKPAKLAQRNSRDANTESPEAEAR